MPAKRKRTPAVAQRCGACGSTKELKFSRWLDGKNKLLCTPCREGAAEVMKDTAEKLLRIARKALRGDSNDAEHDALVEIANMLETPAKPLRPLPDSPEAEIPEDPEEMNDRRAEWAEQGLWAFAQETGQDDAGDWEHDHPSVISDFLADLAHYCDRRGFHLARLLNRAERNYGDETDGNGQQFEPMATIEGAKYAK